MISVIIPLYNKAQYIGKAIQSVLSQTLRDFELIIVNDGSTDSSLEVITQFSDPRIRVINQENKGVSTARNNGAKEAINEYIAFLDADDWWFPHYLEEMNGMINSYPESGLWASKYYKVKQGQYIEAKIGVEDKFVEGPIDYFQVYSNTMWMPVTSSSFIVKKKILEELGGYKSSLKIGEDFDLWSRIAIKHKIAFINNPLVCYNQDVETQNRAVGGLKIYKPENHFIFNLDHLISEEKTNPVLKNLLDKMRLRALFRYHLLGKNREEKERVLNEVDFSKQSLGWKLKYKTPVIIIRTYFSLKMRMSIIKGYCRCIKRQTT